MAKDNSLRYDQIERKRKIRRKANKKAHKGYKKEKTSGQQN